MEGKRPKTAWRRRVGLAGALAAVVAIAWLGLDAWSERELERAVAEARAIAARLLPAQDLPPGPDERALAIDDRARALGYSLRMDPGAPEFTGWESLQPLFHRGTGPDRLRRAVAASERQGPHGDLGADGEWVARHVAAIDALTESLLADPLPRWFAAPDGFAVGEAFPRGGGPLGQHWTGRLLMAASLDALAAGDHALAERRLLASWRLRESLERESNLVPWLVANSLLADQLALLRKIDVSDPEWRRRVDEVDPRRTVLGQLAHDAASQADGLAGLAYWRERHEPVGGSPGPLPWLTRSRAARWSGLAALSRPLRRLVVRDHVAATTESVHRLEAAGACWPNLAELDAKLSEHHGLRDWIFEAPSGHVVILSRALSTELQGDLTSAVLAGRAEGFADGGRIDATCPARAWRSLADGAGGAALIFEGEAPSWAGRQVATLDYSQSEAP